MSSRGNTGKRDDKSAKRKSNLLHGVAKETTMGTPVDSKLAELLLARQAAWDGTLPESCEEERERLRTENAAMREIVQQVAAIREWYGGEQPYDAQISLGTVTKARKLVKGWETSNEQR